MEENNKAVETTTEQAATQTEEVNPLEAQLIEKDALILKLSSERDNYRKGMLKAKGKAGDEDTEETVEDKVSRLVKEQLLETEFSKVTAEKDDLIKKTIARNKELEVALKNRTQISSSGAGSGSEQKLTVKDNVLSDDKLKQLKAMGWNDAKIEAYKKNLMKLR